MTHSQLKLVAKVKNSDIVFLHECLKRKVVNKLHIVSLAERCAEFISAGMQLSHIGIVRTEALNLIIRITGIKGAK